MDKVVRLIEALKDTDPIVRRNAAWALGDIRNAQAIPALVDALKDEERYVRRHAAEALGKIGDPQTVPVLIATLKDRNDSVRRDAAEALRGIASHNPTPALRAALPSLRRLLREASDSGSRSFYRSVLNRIEKATVDRKDLPLTATAPTPASYDNLPIPSVLAGNGTENRPSKPLPVAWHQRLWRLLGGS